MSTPWPVVWFDQIDSTNEEARRRAGAGDISGQWIAAHCQTLGRGRLGRDWVSPVGNLYASALFRWGEDLKTATRLPFAAALAVTDTIETLISGAQPRLKWPNDVRVNGAKIAGILVESGRSGGGYWITVGIGLNVAKTPDVCEQRTTSLADLEGDGSPTAEATLEVLRFTFARRLAEAKEGFETIRAAWLARADGLGHIIRVSPGGKAMEGRFEGLAEDGGLILELPDGHRKIIRTGDVELIKESC